MMLRALVLAGVVSSCSGLRGPGWARRAVSFVRRRASTVETRPTGNSFLPADALERASSPKANPFEKIKVAKDGTSAFTDVYDFAKKIRAGEMTWEEVEKDDMDQRLKWVGLLHRSKRQPGTFMMRLRVPNGIVTSEQLRFYAASVEPYGREIGVVDITTRQSIQLRGVKLEDAPTIIEGLHKMNQTSFQSALDNVRNVVGSPLAGLVDGELVDTRPFSNAVNDLVSLDAETGKRGNPRWGNLPRKFNVAVSGGPEDFAHTHINDIGFQPAAHSRTGEMGFNVVFGGYLSIKRSAEALSMDLWIPATVPDVILLCEAVLEVFRDEGARGDRQKARLIWLVEAYGPAAFKTRIIEQMNKLGDATADVAQPESTTAKEHEILGVHAQKAGLSRVGMHVPSGRLSVEELRGVADLAEKHSDGEVRLTVDQNIILPNVADADVAELLEAIPQIGEGRLALDPGNLIGHTVSCTGSQFCGFGMIETKANADACARALDKLVETPTPLRIHWTGCPNSCAQAQIADIGIMGAPAKKLDPATGKNMAVPGCNIFVGGKIGQAFHLQLEPEKKNIPIEFDILIPELLEIITTHFDGKLK